MSFTLKYETGKEVAECEFTESWSRKVLVATRSLGKGEEEDRVVLNRALELATNTREVEELDEIFDRHPQVQIKPFNTKIIHSYEDVKDFSFKDSHSESIKTGPVSASGKFNAN